MKTVTTEYSITGIEFLMETQKQQQKQLINLEFFDESRIENVETTHHPYITNKQQRKKSN